jgi:hypothetical protein
MERSRSPLPFPGLLDLLRRIEIFHHEDRLAYGGEKLEARDVLADRSGIVRPLLLVLAEEQVFLAEPSITAR